MSRGRVCGYATIMVVDSTTKILGVFMTIGWIIGVSVACVIFLGCIAKLVYTIFTFEGSKS